jgi:hypothetical protein
MIHKKRWLKHQDANQTLFFTACGLIMADLKEGDQAIPRLKTTQGGVPIEVNCEDCLRVANLERLRPDIKCLKLRSYYHATGAEKRTYVSEKSFIKSRS